jgi:protein-S-isoprenylcysteine O-methyltransferase Ste14
MVAPPRHDYSWQRAYLFSAMRHRMGLVSLPEERIMSRYLFLAYGLLAYASFLAVFVAAAAFLGGFALPRTVDAPVTSEPWLAAAIDIALLAAFGLQHSVMARPRFKARLTRVIPTPIERSTYVLASNAMLVLLLLLWQPIDVVLWDVTAPIARTALWILFGAGWVTIVAASFAIDHFELFGVKQVIRNFRGVRHVPPKFHAPFPYRLVRHPLYVGWLLAFFATPTMTLGHLLFAVSSAVYILVAIRFEERDLLAEHGAEYAAWRARTPMLIPRVAPRARGRDRLASG